MLLLTLVPGLGPVRMARCLQRCGDAHAVLHASVAELVAVPGVGRKTAEQIRRGIDELGDGRALAAEHELIERHGVRIVSIDDAEYPRLLRHIDDPPPLLYVRGQLQEQDAVALAVVGARRCTHYGREQAGRLAGLAARAGLTIVSGGAYGVDAAAHRGVLRSGGRTIAVLGSGLADPYPAEHLELFDQIAREGNGENRGAVISELPMATPPKPENFPSRNRIISGLSLGVLVIEASLRSGALITARLAAEEHHREVLALPGRVDSAASTGCHRMIREGWAALVTGLDDILQALGETGQLLAAARDSGQTRNGGDRGGDAAADGDPPSRGNLFEQHLTAGQAKIVEHLRVATDSCDIDALAEDTGLPVPAIRADLTLLEIRGLVRRSGSGYARTSR